MLFNTSDFFVLFSESNKKRTDLFKTVLYFFLIYFSSDMYSIIKNSERLIRYYLNYLRYYYTDVVTTMSFWVSSALDCNFYRWGLFVYFTFPSI